MIGDPAAEVCAVAPLDRAGPRDATMLASARYAAELIGCGAAVVLIDAKLADVPGDVRARVVVEKPYEAMLALLPALYPGDRAEPMVAATARIGCGARLGSAVRVEDYAVVGAGAVIGDGAWIGAHAVIGAGVLVGEGARVHAAATLYGGTVLGARSIVHSGARLGSDGFGYVLREGAGGSGGRHERIPHVGRCMIGADVEIGANSTIDRGSIDDTVIGDGTKIDNLVHIAHNVRMGERCLVMAQVGIAGSTRIGDGAVIAGQAGIGGHASIGAGARIAAQAGVFGDVPAGESWSGYPARPHRESLRASAALLKLPALIRRIEELLGASSRA